MNARRTRNIFDPKSDKSYRLSRSKLDLFLECPRCFYIDRRRGINQPSGPPFTLNVAVDALLKKEFDSYRAQRQPHPLMLEYGINALPFQHEKLEEWRDSLRRGIQYLHPGTNLTISGGVDDVWINADQELFIVDYKATSKKDEVNLDADWQIGYKRQMEIYQWLFRMNGFAVSNIGYFVYCNGDTEKDCFEQRLHFRIKIIPYEGQDGWIEGVINAAYQCLISDNLPAAGESCTFCLYRKAVASLEEW